MMKPMTEFRYCRPDSLAEVARLRTEYPDARVMAGGTDFLVNLRRGLARPPAVIDLSGVAGMATIDEGPDGVRIGAAVTLAALTSDELIRDRFPALVSAASSVAGPTHRAAATIGGNLCQDTRCMFYNQSEWWRSANGYCLKRDGGTCHVVVKKNHCYATYHGDLAPVLMVLGASAELAGPAGKRRLPLSDLFRQDGARHLALSEGEVLAGVTVRAEPGLLAGYTKIRIRNAVDFPLAAVAVALRREGKRIGGLRVAITGTNSAPLMVPVADLTGQEWGDAVAERMVAAIRQACDVVKTTTSVSPKYRRRVLLASTRQLADQLWNQAT